MTTIQKTMNLHTKQGEIYIKVSLYFKKSTYRERETKGTTMNLRLDQVCTIFLLSMYIT